MNRLPRRLRALTALTALVLLGACSSSSSSADPTTTGPATTVAMEHTSVPSTLSPEVDRALTPVEGTYGVGRTEVTFVDHNRDVEGNESEDPDADKRTLRTVILYPTVTTDADDDTPRSIAKGVFPLIVFSHGVTAEGATYAPVLEPLVAAGYVVALPTFPLTNGPDGWNHLDQVPAQAQDVSFVITRLLNASTETNTLLNGHLSSDAVAVAGHSLGAATSLMFYNSCCGDDRVKAVIAVAGIPFAGDNDADAYDDPPTGVPLLLLHGTDDDTVPDAGSEKAFGMLTGVPRALVLFEGVGHVDIVVQPLVDASMIGFLDMVLRGDPNSWEQATADMEADPDVTLETADGLPGAG